MEQKAQAQVITTILIILLVLAVIVIVYQVVRGTVGSAGEEAERMAECASLNLWIKGAVIGDTNNVKVERGTGNADLQQINFLVNGVSKSKEGAVINELETKDFSIALAAGDKVSIAPIIGTGTNEYQCPVVDSAIV